MISTHSFYEKKPTSTITTQIVGEDKDRILIEVYTRNASARCEITPAALAALLNHHGPQYGALLQQEVKKADDGK